ncbi:MAG: hypothetical protein JXR96_16755 [Deltaproteobacteria bacterium]|nr:hypothetical protein [Deltaproteobacteria bacterium]
MKYQALAILATLLLPVDAPAQWYSGQHDSGSYAVELVVHGSPLATYHHYGHDYVEGRYGDRYAIRIHNRTWRRVEAIVSVDGRDAIDGRSSSLSKRGYVVPPYSYIDVDGFRLNNYEVAAFRFTSVPDSYTARMGTAWKVGIVGVAFFPERVRRPRPPLVRRRGAPGDWYTADEERAMGGASRESAKAAPYSHHNLGTQFGERRASPVSETSFTRENWSRPEARLSLRYDDRQGLCNLGIGAFCYPTYPPPPPPPPYYPPPRDYAQPPPGWEHFSPWY